MARIENEKQHIYIIPDNFIEGGRIFNGMFKLRNFVEGVILGGFFAMLAMMIPVEETTTRITVVVSFALPWFMLAIMGINGDPLSVFLMGAYRWKKNRRVMHYNDQTHAREERPVDMMLSDELAKDKIIDAYENWNSKRQESARLKFDSDNWEFEQDTELSKLKTKKEKAMLAEEKAKKRKERDRNAPAEQNSGIEFVDAEADSIDALDISPEDVDSLLLDSEDLAVMSDGNFIEEA